MSIWGTIIGGATGFALGGPLGAIIGGVAGHAVDKINPKEALPQEKAIKEIGFTIGVIVLSAKMAKADGKVTKDEIIAFQKKVMVPKEERKNVERLWKQAEKTIDGFEVYAKQIAILLGLKSPVLEQLLNILFFIAKADGVISSEEIIYLKKINFIFGFTNNDFKRIKLSNINIIKNPYTILGVHKETSIKDIKNVWKKLVINNHPDKLMAAGMPLDFIEKSTIKLQEINHAWDTIKKELKH